ncbi:unknown protein [Microcystis aeruginosa NIES-843]|uniref:Uncharacterized protein n=1 Tax=Microcystis aeruginosa (strain NIES-843 / IAM M-2473) TaxID=449447 RepID=B0JQC7_MICAN|nr:unknown protein [Microcystis aeruginosa NIES-843]
MQEVYSIYTNNRNIFNNGLSYQKAIKGVFMIKRKGDQRIRMFWCDGKDIKLILIKAYVDKIFVRLM